MLFSTGTSGKGCNDISIVQCACSLRIVGFFSRLHKRLWYGTNYFLWFGTILVPFKVVILTEPWLVWTNGVEAQAVIGVFCLTMKQPLPLLCKQHDVAQIGSNDIRIRAYQRVVVTITDQVFICKYLPFAKAFQGNPSRWFCSRPSGQLKYYM